MDNWRPDNLISSQIKKNDEVIIPSMTFSATANVLEILGVKPIFVDVEKDTLLANYNEILKKLTKDKSNYASTFVREYV